MLNFKKHVLTGSAALLLLTAAGAGQAIGQGAGAAPAQRSSANADQGKLEEVIVTAEKRSENLQSVPFSITSLTSRTLVTQGITSFVDYGTKVPNLAFANTGDGIAQARTISIRGISGDNTTGFYIDNTPVPDSVDPRIIDIDHIEVLRGPQGTLYGARSMGGTVRVITKQPNADDMSGSLDANLSTTHLGGTNYSLNGVWNAPLVADKLGLRIVGL
ncbi:MAG: TonB-dependent receptor plug domain-containing protein [Alphaproteobacteria bacterium]|nr:TonB-dependent receptor plug domain-containing protein [Alphaproteobacteria bacterium]